MELSNLQSHIIPLGKRIKCKSSVINNKFNGKTHILQELQKLNNDETWSTVAEWEKDCYGVFCSFETDFELIEHGFYCLKTEAKTYTHKYCETATKYSISINC